MKKLIETNFQKRKNALYDKIIEEYLSLPRDASTNQRVQYLSDKYNRSETGIIYILKERGVYEGRTYVAKGKASN